MENVPTPEEQVNLFEKMDSAPRQQNFRKFQRSRNNSIIAGVCSGIADYIKADIGLVRLLAILTLLLGGWSVLAYLLTASLMPVNSEPQIMPAEQLRQQRKENFRVLLSGFLILAGLQYAMIALGISTSARMLFMPHGLVFPIAAFFIGITILINRGFDPEAPPANYTAKFYRSKHDRRILGVCGGFGKYIDADSSALRIIFIIMTMLTLGFFALIYVLLFLSTSFEPDNNFE